MRNLTGQETLIELDKILDWTLEEVLRAPEKNYELTSLRHDVARRMSLIQNAHHGDPCIYCGVAHDDVAPGECAQANAQFGVGA